MAQGERSGACGDPCVRKIVSERDSVAIGDDTLEGARTHHRAGDIAAAEAIYRTILAAHPAHAETLHLNWASYSCKKTTRRKLPD